MQSVINALIYMSERVAQTIPELCTSTSYCQGQRQVAVLYRFLSLSLLRLSLLSLYRWNVRSFFLCFSYLLMSTLDWSAEVQAPADWWIVQEGPNLKQKINVACELLIFLNGPLMLLSNCEV